SERRLIHLVHPIASTNLTPTLIAMGFPCPSLPKTLYRNGMTQALKFLDSKPFIYNLCFEPGWSYPSNCFHGN
ncbi:hypothetical protein BJ741DRAFT_596220, partial [Chytriomyces cf. hyalinus JEL632]